MSNQDLTSMTRDQLLALRNDLMKTVREDEEEIKKFGIGKLHPLKRMGIFNRIWVIDDRIMHLT